MPAAAGTTLELLDIDAILKLLPHRYPFLMIDRIIKVDGDDSAIGIKNISVNEPIFQGHFPGHPITPLLRPPSISLHKAWPGDLGWHHAPGLRVIMVELCLR